MRFFAQLVALDEEYLKVFFDEDTNTFFILVTESLAGVLLTSFTVIMF